MRSCRRLAVIERRKGAPGQVSTQGGCDERTGRKCSIDRQGGDAVVEEGDCRYCLRGIDQIDAIAQNLDRVMPVVVAHVDANRNPSSVGDFRGNTAIDVGKGGSASGELNAKS